MTDGCKTVFHGCFKLYVPLVRLNTFSICLFSFLVSSAVNCMFISFAQFHFVSDYLFLIDL